MSWNQPRRGGYGNKAAGVVAEVLANLLQVTINVDGASPSSMEVVRVELAEGTIGRRCLLVAQSGHADDAQWSAPLGPDKLRLVS